MESKITCLEELIPIVSTRRQTGKQTIVFTNGCFDLLHIGHIRYLQEAKKLGDLLIVGINSDTSIHALEKAQGRPVIPGDQRAEVLSALACVDFVVPFDEPDPLRLIEGLLPDILVKGGDWTLDRIMGRDVVEAHGGMVYSIPLVPDVSTTKIIERIQSTLPQTPCQEEATGDKGPSAASRTVL
jgi:D-beta-D-heptose 7-phosphate kinase/D-beta-D-heptose 1-phosphate adenosyltransferase